MPIKINIFGWRLALDCLPIRSNLSMKGIDAPNIMHSLCDNGMELASHIFFSLVT